jgi:hypothetical protein
MLERVDAHAYSGETEPERRLELEDALIAGEVKRSWRHRLHVTVGTDLDL